MTNAFRNGLTGLLLLTALSTGAPAQNPIEERAIPIDQLVLRYYTPRDVDRDDLQVVAEELFGSSMLVKNAEGDLDNVNRFLLLDYSIIIRDTAARADEVVRALTEVEDALYPLEEDQTAARTHPALLSFEYAPRFLSTDSVLRALRGFSRQIQIAPPPGGGQWAHVDNIRAFEERNMILVRETAEKLEEIELLLSKIDVPVPQATFSIMVIRGQETDTVNGGGGAGQLPPELAQHLQRMVPVKGFDLLATAVLRSSTRDSLRLNTKADDDTQFELFLDPIAFDQESGELTVRKCSFQAQTRTYKEVLDPNTGESRGRSQSGWEEQGFETALSLRNAEYTVLGSVGQDPLFVVLRMEL